MVGNSAGLVDQYSGPKIMGQLCPLCYIVAPNIVLVANAVGLVASCYICVCQVAKYSAHSATPDGLTTVPSDHAVPDC